jgi:hypothetical protein
VDQIEITVVGAHKVIFKTQSSCRHNQHISRLYPMQVLPRTQHHNNFFIILRISFLDPGIADLYPPIQHTRRSTKSPPICGQAGPDVLNLLRIPRHSLEARDHCDHQA